MVLLLVTVKEGNFLILVEVVNFVREEEVNFLTKKVNSNLILCFSKYFKYYSMIFNDFITSAI